MWRMASYIAIAVASRVGSAKSSMHRPLTVFFIWLLVVHGSALPDTIETFSSWNGSTYISGLGEPLGGSSGQTLGQTFRLNQGDDTLLDSITFYVYDFPYSGGPGDVNFALYLYEWDGSRPSGDPLFASSQLAAKHDQTTYEGFTINTGRIELSEGTNYVWFLSALPFNDGVADTAYVAQFPHTYPNGHLVSFRDTDAGGDFNALTAIDWKQWTDNDLTFIMEFSPIPLPAAVWMGLTMFGGMGVFGMVRKRFRRAA